MLVSFEELKKVLQSTGLEVTRDRAINEADYPYIVYSHVNQGKKKASSKIHRKLPYYQVSLFTSGTEQDLEILEEALNRAGIPYADFASIKENENNDIITNYYTYIRCVEHVEK